jgi:hypothetical protein
MVALLLAAFGFSLFTSAATIQRRDEPFKVCGNEGEPLPQFARDFIIDHNATSDGYVSDCLPEVRAA